MASRWRLWVLLLLTIFAMNDASETANDGETEAAVADADAKTTILTARGHGTMASTFKAPTEARDHRPAAAAAEN